MSLFIKQKQIYKHRKQTYCYQRGKAGAGVGGRDKLEEFGINIYTLL